MLGIKMGTRRDGISHDGEIIIPFINDGHMGVCVECSIDGGPWGFVTIYTTSP